MRIPKIKIEAGDKFERLEVIARAPNKPGSRDSWWICRCVCGTVKDIAASSLTRERGTRSCGCLLREQRQQRFMTHGQTNTRAYSIWWDMIQRCRNKNRKGYRYYGGRGIAVCERWQKFEAFLEDMGQPPPGLTLEREDNDGPYSPDNCKWATRTEQARNKRNNRLLTVNGLTLPVAAWAERNGVLASTIRVRLSLGYSDTEAVAPRSFHDRSGKRSRISSPG